jgi:hypothetical protein
MILDPAKTYADVSPSGRVLALITGVSEIPSWAMQRRRIVELPEGATVNVGDVHLGGLSFRAAVVFSDAEVAWRKIQQRREQAKGGGVNVPVDEVDKWFHTDDASRIQHLGLVMMGAGMPQGIQWKTMNGTFVVMTQALAGQIFSAVAALDMASFAVAEQHRAAMQASADPAAYDFSAGWPETFA